MSWAMRPDTWLPTWTVTSAESVPVAVTRATIRPRSTEAVSNFSSDDFFPHPTASTASAMAAAARSQVNAMLLRFIVETPQGGERLSRQTSMGAHFFKDPAEARRWFQKHHAQETELLVGFWKVGTGKGGA